MKKPARRQNSDGNVTVMVMAVLLIISILLLPLVQKMKSNTKQNVDFISNEKSRMLARQGVEKGLWKLNESPANLATIRSGGRITGYKDDATYSDGLLIQEINSNQNLTFGTYKILLTSGACSSQVEIITSGLARNKISTATINAVYEDDSINSAIYVESDQQIVDWSVTSTIDMQGTPVSPMSLWNGAPVVNIPQVHWGSVKSLRGIDSTDAPFFPRKYAKNKVLGRDDGSTRANSDTKEYWANANDLPIAPLFDLETMKRQAIASVDNFGSSTYVAVSSVVPALYLNRNTTWFYQQDLTINGPTFYQGIVIVMGNLTIDLGATGANAGNEMLGSPVPQNAAAEYAKHVEVTGDYPIDSGLSNLNPAPVTYDFPMNAIGMRAFIYVNGNVEVKNIQSPNLYGIYGSLYVKGSITVDKTANFRVYRGVFANPACQTVWAPSELVPSPAFLRHTWKIVSYDEN